MARLVINANKKVSKIHKEIYGHFSEHLGRCIYEGIYVGEDSPIENVNGMRTDVVEALKEIWIPVLRWPGGCFADEYHWMDGIGPKENRKKIINTFEPWVYCQDSVFRVHDTWKTKAQAGDVIPSHTAFLQEDQSQAAGFLQRALIVVMKTLDALLGYQVSL